MSSRSRRIRKWAVRLVLVLTSLAALDIGILLYPTPLFAYSERFGSYRVYSDEPIPGGMAGVIEDLNGRLAAMEHGSPGGNHRIYLCNSTRRYALLAFLARRGAESQAIGLSFPNESFVQMPRLRRFAALNRETLPHSRFEGNLAEAVAHEIAHFNSLRALGLRRHLALPVWKSEGWAEYQANLAAIRADAGYDLHARIDRLLDEGFWARDHGASRRMWEAQLLAEFLGEVKGFRLADLAREEVRESSARDAMMEWWRSRNDTAPSGENG